MIQFYFLSVLCNAVAGYLLFRNETNDWDFEAGLKLSANSDVFRLVFGILTIITGLFKLLSPVPGSVPVLGDFIPAIFGFISGFVILFEYYKKTATIISDNTALLELFLTRYKKQIGFFCIVSAVLHFLFPQSLLM